MPEFHMQQALSEFQGRVVSIERTIDLLDALLEFGQALPESVPPEGAKLHHVVGEIRQAGLQPILNGSVLLLAAALEQFVTDVIVGFSDNLPNIVSKYENLPERIRFANEQMTGQAISDSRFRNRFTVFQLPRFVENLRNCQVGISPYFLNGEALALHNSNLNPQLLGDLTGRLGVEGIWGLIGSTETLKDWSELEIAKDIQTRARGQLEELIYTRNQIAHRVGVENPGPDIVRSFVSFLKALAQSLVTALIDHANILASKDNPTSQS